MIDEVNPGRLLDQLDLAGSGLAEVILLVPQDFGTTRAVDADRVRHGCSELPIDELFAGLAGAGLVQLRDYMAAPHLNSGALVQALAEYAVDA